MASDNPIRRAFENLMGQRILPPARPQESREVAFLASRVRGLDEEPPEEFATHLLELQDRHFRLLLDAVTPHNGDIQWVFHDVILCAFNAWTPVKSPLQAAFDSAITVFLSSEKTLNRRLAIAVSSGFCQLGTVGNPDSRHEVTLFGHAAKCAVEWAQVPNRIQIEADNLKFLSVPKEASKFLSTDTKTDF